MWRELGGRRVGVGEPVFVVAEIGLNHGGSLERALDLVEAAAWAGASAIKLQTLDADLLVTASCPAPAHVRASSLRAFLSRFELDASAHRAVVDRARAHQLAVLATPLYEQALEMLERLEVDAYKIASGDLTCDGLIAAAASTRRPLVLSTGMSNLAEIDHALAVAHAAGANGIALLHCVSAYPTPVDQQNLRAIATLSRTFGGAVGLSDHGRTPLVSAVAMVALGGCLYERHLVLDTDDDAIDREVSSTPAELKAIVEAMEQARMALGTGEKVCQPAEEVNRTASRRGLYAARDLQPGERISSGDVVALRPMSSLPPWRAGQLVGAIARRRIAAGEPFTLADLREARAS
jgi:sialic acid synthase SpsE